MGSRLTSRVVETPNLLADGQARRTFTFIQGVLIGGGEFGSMRRVILGDEGLEDALSGNHHTL